MFAADWLIRVQGARTPAAGDEFGNGRLGDGGFFEHEVLLAGVWQFCRLRRAEKSDND
jgi:hypothetical protein